MDGTPVRFGEVAAAAAGALLLFVLAVAPWFSYTGTFLAYNAFAWLRGMDLVLAAAALTPVLLLAARLLAPAQVPLRFAGAAAVVAGAAAAALIAFRLAFPGDGPEAALGGAEEFGVTRAPGGVLALIAAAGIVLAGAAASRGGRAGREAAVIDNDSAEPRS